MYRFGFTTKVFGLAVILAATLLFSVPNTVESTAPRTTPGLVDDPIIDRFTAADCVSPDPRRGILAYRVVNVSHVRIEAIHRDGRSRTFYSQGGRTVVPAIGATNVADPGATADVEAYVLVARGASGSEVRRRQPFRYRIVEFELRSGARHIRDTTGDDHLARYEADAHLVHFDSLACVFRFDAAIAGERFRPGTARLTQPPRWPSPIVSCEIPWRDRRKARAGGIVLWNAIVSDGCSPSQIIRSARVAPIP